jgi:hypothetical protein
LWLWLWSLLLLLLLLLLLPLLMLLLSSLTRVLPLRFGEIRSGSACLQRQLLPVADPTTAEFTTTTPALY